MKHIKKIAVMFLVLSIFITVPTFAKNNVSNIDIFVSIRDDGSAYIKQVWMGSFYEGTENYIVINDEDISVSSLKVSDGEYEYEFVNEWDIDKSFDEKAKKCGFHRNGNSLELCFGISEYGEREYTIEYVIDGFIKSYSDFDGTNFMLINPEMSTFPTNGRIEISLENESELNEKNAGIWAFGYEGAIEFYGGNVVAYTKEELEDDECMIVLLRLNKGTVYPTMSVDKTFEEVRAEAFEDSDYQEEMTLFDKIVLAGMVSIFILAFGGVLFAVIKRKREIKKFYNEANYFREVPNGGDMCLTYYLSQAFDMAKDKSLIIGALMLSMMNKGCLLPETEVKEGIFGKTKKSVNLVLVKEPEDGVEKRLYNILKAASGKDGILQEKELERYAYNHPNKISDMIDDFKSDGEAKIINMQGFGKRHSNVIKCLSEVGKRELAEAMGLKKYLEDFSLIAEREIEEVAVWRDYMTYATLFGIADKVIEQFEKVYPEKIEEIREYNGNVILMNRYYRNMYSASQRAVSEQRVRGGGGASSIGGGGGFSGGGVGGGSR